MLHLSVPDFALDEQKDCANTFVHCDPTRHFKLTSPYCTQGNLVFLQSAFKQAAAASAASSRLSSRQQVTSTQPTGSSSSSSSAGPSGRASDSEKQLAFSPGQFLTQRMTELKEEVDQMAIHFQAERGRFSHFKVYLQAGLRSAQQIQFVAPLANLYIG
jgi:hypothetical protein